MPCQARVIGPRWTFGSRGMSISGPRGPGGAAPQLASVATLVLLAGAAPARIVTPELRLRRRRGRYRGAAVAAGLTEGALRLCLPLCVARLLLLLALGLLGGLHGDPEDLLRHAARDARRHLFEERVSLALVGDERVLLAIAAQVDALAELLHRGEVLDPVDVDRAQEDPPLHHARQLLAELGLAPFVRLVDELRDLLSKLVQARGVGERRRGDLVGAAQHRAERRGEPCAVPFLGVRRDRVRVDHGRGLVVKEADDRLPDVAFLDDLPALVVDDVALVVENVVELERALADVEVAALDLDLRLGDRPGHHPRLDRDGVVEAEPRHEPGDALRGEDADEVVLERAVEARGARVALAAGTPAELVVDTAGLVALGADDVEAALRDDAGPQEDVDAAAGHVRRERHRAVLSGVRDDECLALVVLRVQDLALDAVSLELLREPLALLHARRADEHRLTLLVALRHLGDDGVPLALLGLVDEVVEVRPDHRLVRRDLRDLELVDLVELLRLGRGGPGHSRELGVPAEVVLDRDRRERTGLALDLEAFLRLDRLMQAVRPAAAGHEAAGELVDNDDLAVLDDVFLVAVVERLRP